MPIAGKYFKKLVYIQLYMEMRNIFVILYVLRHYIKDYMGKNQNSG